METKSNPLRIRAVEDTIQGWANRTHISQATRQKILNSNVLLIPDEGYIEEDLLYFPAGTSDFFRYLNEKKSKDLEIEACIDDEDYQELSLHEELLIIAKLVVTILVAPIVVNLVSEYIKNKLGERKNRATVKTRLIVTVEDDKRSIEISYDGPANEYRDQMLEAISRLKSTPHSQLPQLQKPPQQSKQKKINKKKRKKKRKK